MEIRGVGGWGTAHCCATLGALGNAQPTSAKDEGILVRPMHGRLGGISSQTEWWCVGRAELGQLPRGLRGVTAPGVFQNHGCGTSTAGSTAGDGFGLDLVVLEIFSNPNGSALPGVRKQQGSFPHRQTLGTASKLK